MDTMSMRDDDNNYLMIDDYNNGHTSPLMSNNKRNLSPALNDDRRDRNFDRNYQRDHRTRSRSRSYDDRGNSRRQGSSNHHRSRSPRRDRDRSRDRNTSYRRSENTGRSSGSGGSGGGSSRHDKYKWEKTVYVSNIPYDVRWTELKDLFRSKLGVEPNYCELFEKDGKSLGVGSIEFKSVSDAERAVEVMHQYEIGGRRMSVRIDGEGYKTKQAKEMAGESSSGHHHSSSSSSNRHSSSSNRNQNQNDYNNTDSNSTAAALLASTLASSLGGAGSGQPNLLALLGIGNPLLTGASGLLGNNLLGSASASNSLLNQNALLNQVASQLKVEGPVTSRLFVASLDYKVDEQKIREVFNLAGHVTNVSLFRDRDNKSRGMAVVEYDTSFEALNAVSMFNKQTLMDRQMTVRFDTKPPKEEELVKEKSLLGSGSQSKLPSGLRSIGNSLGLNLLGSNQNTSPQSNNNSVNPLTLGALTSDLSASLGLNVNSNGLGLLGNFGTQGGLSSNTNGSPLNRSLQGSGSNNNSMNNPNNISKIFVKNIPFSWDERKLKDKFRQAGSIEFADIKIKDGKSRGCGLIRFSNSDQAQKAVELFNGSRFEGRTLDVKLDLF